MLHHLHVTELYFSFGLHVVLMYQENSLYIECLQKDDTTSWCNLNALALCLFCRCVTLGIVVTVRQLGSDEFIFQYNHLHL
jgi:hypothetical protein